MAFAPRQIRKGRKIQLDEFAAAEAAESEVEKPEEVPDGPELLRICELERREIPDPDSGDSQRLAAFLTAALGKKAPADLYPGPLTGTQALAIREGKMHNGGFFPMVVGGGKMLVSYLLAAMYLAEGKRVAYVCPGANEPDARTEFPEYYKSWKGPALDQLQILTYERLSNPSSAAQLHADGSVKRVSLLESMRPDVLIFDESHNLANLGGAGARHVRYYVESRTDLVVFALSGTPFLKSIKDPAHLMEWALGARSPLPRRSAFVELHSWAGYLDPKASALGQMKIGALVELLRSMGVEPDIWDESLEAKQELLELARRTVARRILETPGVIGTQDAPLSTPITMEAWVPSQVCGETDEVYRQVMLTDTLPDGTELPDALSKNRHLSTLGLDFYSKWEPAPPVEWTGTRNEWARWCRRGLKYNKHKISSEAQMKGALRRGLYKSGLPILQAWEAASKAYLDETGMREPPSVAQWIEGGNEVVASVREWLQKVGCGLVWVQSVGLGQKLAAELQIPYYGAGGGFDEKTGRNILQHPGGSAIASLDACGTGKSLQYLWSQNLWLCTPGEQSLARTHRRGQPAPVVRNFVYIGCLKHLEALNRARDTKATFQEQMLDSPQKLKYAEWLVHETPLPNGFRWTAKDVDD